MATVFDRQKVLDVALAEVGYLEKRSNANLYDKTANAGYNNYTKYGYEMHQIYPKTMDYPAPYCDAFVDWCFYKAYGVTNAQKLLCGEFDDYTVNSAGLYKSKNAYYKRGTKTPEPGWQIFFTNASGGICHTGLVYAVGNGRVYTVEGNTSGGSTVIANGGGVAKKSYPLDYSRIDGYGAPAYGKKVNIKPTAAPAKTVAPAKYVVPQPTLKKGSKGTAVSNLQKCLNKVMGASLVVDGDFGPKTDTIVRSFQSKYKLGVDGIYGPKSYAKLKSLF